MKGVFKMEKQLLGKVALITGSSSGIGRAVALRFAQAGADVVITSSKKSSESGKKVAMLAASYGVKAVYVQADLGVESDIDYLFEETESNFGRLDILVNNAGTQKGGNIDTLTMNNLDEEMRVNVYALIKCTQNAKRLMGEKGWIINTSSFRGLDYAGRAPIMGYCASKATVNSLTKSLALDLAPNIFVNAVMPGFVYTQNYDKFDENLKKTWMENTAIKRFVTPEEIAEVFLFLATTKILTGSIIAADGGASLLNR